MGIRTRRARAHSKTHFVGFGLAGVFGFIALLCVTLALSLGAVVSSWLEDLPDYTSADAFLVAEPTRVYDADGNEIVAYYLQNRRSVELDQISDYVKQGTVDTEDIRFYQHNGIDPEGILRALMVQITGGSEGGSTITQQLVRNTVLSDEQFENTLRRKVREAYIAIQMEKTYTKDQILNMYLNTIFYGNGAYGIEAASIIYFNKHASELTLNEAATLVGIPNSPTYYNPFTNYDACKSRRNTVLDRMLGAGSITQEEHDAAVAEEIPLNPGELTDSQSSFPYFTDYVRNLLLQDFSSDTIQAGGLNVYTTLDPDLQRAAETAAADRVASSGNDQLGAALVSIDNSNGYIVAMVGGQSYGNDTDAGQSTVNLATNQRQTGSSFKSVVLMAALQAGMSPTVMINCPATIQITPTYRPANIDYHNYGVRSLASATAVSSNTGYVQVAEAIGMDKVAEMAKTLGIDTQIEPGLSSALGATQLSPLEMAEAYSTIATGGTHRNPVAITRIEDRNGNVVYEHEDDPEQAVDEAITCDAIDVLGGVTETGGTASSVSQLFDADQPVAGKTGTSDNYADLWFCGFTPQYTTVVWTGRIHDNQRVYYRGSIGSVSNLPIPIWCSYMNEALDGVDREEFPTPDHEATYEPNNSWTFVGTNASANQKRRTWSDQSTSTQEDEEEGEQNAEPTTPTTPQTPTTPETSTGGSSGGSTGGGSGGSSGGSTGGGSGGTPTTPTTPTNPETPTTPTTPTSPPTSPN